MTEQATQTGKTLIGSGCLISMKRLLRDQKGIAAMEFALVVPILISLYFMMNETANGMRAARKVTIVSRVMADLTSRSADVTDAQRNDIFSAAVPLMSPFAITGSGFRLTSIRFDKDNKGFVDWSESSGNGLPPLARCKPTDGPNAATNLSVPTGLKTASTSLILAEANVKYKPVVGWNITGTIDLGDKLYMRPRVSDFVTRNGATQANCPGSNF
jgi:Flp pilus assembly protein TadG